MELAIVYSALFGFLVMLALALSAKGLISNEKGNWWLCGFTICGAIIMLDSALDQKLFYVDTYFQVVIVFSALIAAPPMLYIGAVHFIAPDNKLQKNQLWHFLPALIALIGVSMLWLYFFLKAPPSIGDGNIGLDERAAGAQPFFADLIYWSFYLVLSLFALYKHRRHLRGINSEIQSKDLHWLRNILWGLFVVVCFWLNERLGALPQFEPITVWIYAIGIVYLGWQSLHQKEVFPFPKTVIPEIEAIFERIDHPVRKHELFTDSELDLLKLRLDTFMAESKPFLEPELSLPKLATMLDFRPQELSELINRAYRENFYTFINRYRVEYSTKILQDPAFAHLNMLGVAFESGFNSKTTFNQAFKAQTGLSPTAFKRENTQN